MKAATIMNIEVSALCNLKCQYCMGPLQAQYRPVGLMSTQVYDKAMEWLLHYVGKWTQTELNLFGVGEPLMNLNLPTYVRRARAILPLFLPVHINTNGGFLTQSLAQELKDAGIDQIDITGHNAMFTARSLRVLKALNIKTTVSYDFAINANDWAGQVPWFKSEHRYQCPWVTRGQIFIAWNGDILQCCFDAKATNKLGNIMTSDYDDIECSSFELCKSCHQIASGI
jgi:MoaA/NifB/PqqE/SkfB family radical SAM enzyme